VWRCVPQLGGDARQQLGDQKVRHVGIVFQKQNG